jgi:opacity protein-like surface antigen
LRLAVVIVVALSAWLAIAANATAAQWQYFQTDGDHFYDVAAIDRNANGRFDDIYFDLDNDGPYDTNLYNSRYSDSLLEVIDFDLDENDEVDARLLDGDQRVGFDYIYVDRDQNGYWDRWRGRQRRIIPSSNIDNVTRSNRYNASSRLINDYRQQTGISLLYPSLPTAY